MWWLYTPQTSKRYWEKYIVINFIPGTETQTWLQLLRQNFCSPFLMAINKQNNRHTTPLETHIAFIMPRPKVSGSRQKSGTGENTGSQWMNPRNNQFFDCKYSQSNINFLSSPVISVSPPLNNAVIHPHHKSSVCQQSSRSSHNTPLDNWWFNSKDRNSKSN